MATVFIKGRSSQTVKISPLLMQLVQPVSLRHVRALWGPTDCYRWPALAHWHMGGLHFSDRYIHTAKIFLCLQQLILFRYICMANEMTMVHVKAAQDGADWHTRIHRRKTTVGLRHRSYTEALGTVEAFTTARSTKLHHVGSTHNFYFGMSCPQRFSDHITQDQKPGTQHRNHTKLQYTVLSHQEPTPFWHTTQSCYTGNRHWWLLLTCSLIW